MWQIWFKLFFRNSKKNWLHTFINICGLTSGLIGLILVLLNYNKEYSYDQWNPYKNVIYKVGHAWGDGQVFDDTTQPEGPKSTEVIPEILDYFTMPSWYESYMLKVGDKSVYTKKTIFGASNYFEFFPHPILEGNPKEILASKDKIVISDQIRTQLFGNAHALGKSITIGEKNFTVSGVFKLMQPSILEPNVIINSPKNTSMKENWGSFSNHTYYKIAEGTDIKELEQKLLQVFINNYYKEDAKKEGLTLNEYMKDLGSTPFLERLNGLRLHSKGDLGPLEGKGNYRFLMIMLGLSILIIIISCINFINLSIALASQRAKEVGIKKTLGISSSKLMFQYALEIITQCIVALLFALIIVELVLPIFNDYLNTSLKLNSPKLLLQVTVLILVIAFCIGTLYAFYMFKFKTIETLKGNFSRSKNMVFLRHLMLGLQFVISGFFLIGGLVVYHQVSYMNSKKLGFAGDQVMVVEFADSYNRWKHYQLVKSVFKNDPNVIDVSTSLETPGVDEDFSQSITYEDKIVDTKFIPLDFGHLEMLQTEMVYGRHFSNQFASDTISNIILNETAVKRLGLKNPINKTVAAFGRDFKIVGVVKDYHTNGFDKQIKPIFYLHFNVFSWMKNNVRNAQFKLKPEQMEQTVAKIERFWSTELEPSFPFNYYFVDKQFAKTFEKYKQQQTLFTILTVVVIFIALLGLFALASLTIQQRLKEVAIRKTLGASVKEIMFQLAQSFINIVLIASVILIPVAFYLMQNWLNNFVYRIDMPILPYVIAPIVLILLVIIVVGFKAFNATKVDLIKYLKFE
ncbi:ABC transporter permease [Psychroserpens sp. MEBiC05023]